MTDEERERLFEIGAKKAREVVDWAVHPQYAYAMGFLAGARRFLWEIENGQVVLPRGTQPIEAKVKANER